MPPEVRLRERGPRFLSDSEAATLLAAVELVRRLHPQPSRCDIIISPGKAARYLFLRHARPSQEVFGALYFDAQGRCVGEVVLFRGMLWACTVNRLPILTEAVRRKAESVVLFHNHPSGNPTPSASDVAITGKVRRGCEAIGVSLLDHLILGAEGAVSLRQLDPPLFRRTENPSAPQSATKKRKSRARESCAAERGCHDE